MVICPATYLYKDTFMSSVYVCWCSWRHPCMIVICWQTGAYVIASLSCLKVVFIFLYNMGLIVYDHFPNLNDQWGGTPLLKQSHLMRSDQQQSRQRLSHTICRNSTLKHRIAGNYIYVIRHVYNQLASKSLLTVMNMFLIYIINPITGYAG